MSPLARNTWPVRLAQLGVLVITVMAVWFILEPALSSADGANQATPAVVNPPAGHIPTFLDAVTDHRPGVWGERLLYLALGTLYLFAVSMLFAWLIHWPEPERPPR